MDEGDVVGSVEAVDLLARLRAREWRLTPQRRVVAEVLHGEHVHLTAESIHEQARQRLPEISLATVYNTLNELVAIGEVMEVIAAEGAKRYDPNVVERHQHLHCVSCHELLDVRPLGERELGLSADERHGYEIVDVDVVFQGLCPRCQG